MYIRRPRRLAFQRLVNAEDEWRASLLRRVYSGHVSIRPSSRFRYSRSSLRSPFTGPSSRATAADRSPAGLSRLAGRNGGGAIDGRDRESGKKTEFAFFSFFSRHDRNDRRTGIRSRERIRAKLISTDGATLTMGEKREVRRGRLVEARFSLLASLHLHQAVIVVINLRRCSFPVSHGVGVITT